MTLHRCPDCRCDAPDPQPATSSALRRRVLIDGVAQVIASNKHARTAVNPPDSEETDR